jgi:Protein of unknown function (DUF2934)
MASRRTPDLSRIPEANPAKKRARARTATRVGQKSAATAADVAVSTETRQAMIAEAAYLRAEQRGFASGHEEEDWLLAERDVDALLSAHHGHAAQ